MRAGHGVRVVAISGGRLAQKKLYDLGIITGERLKVIRNDGIGPLLVGIYGAKVVLGTGMAQKVRVILLD
mgnify:CR=1 FL=1